MPGFIGFWELLALAAVLLLLFGPRRLPEIGRSLGKGMREFKESISTPMIDDGDGESVTAADTEQLSGSTPRATRSHRTSSRRRTARGRR